MFEMKNLIFQHDGPHSFKEEAYTSICDGLIIFCDQLSSQKWMETLVYKPDQELQRLLNRFMQGIHLVFYGLSNYKSINF